MISSRSALVARGYDVGEEHPIKFLHNLKDQHAIHVGLSFNNQALKEASANGQEPVYAAVGGTGIAATTTLRYSPTEVFEITCPGGVIHPAHASSTMAALYYSIHHLGIEKVLSFTGDTAQILPFMLGKVKITGSHMQNWQDAAWEPITAALQKRPEYIGATWEQKFRLAAIELAQHNADVIKAFIAEFTPNGHANEVTVLPVLHDEKKGELTFYDSLGVGQPYHEVQTIPSQLSKNSNGPHKALGCSCCDSRALHSHVYCARVGEYHELNVIGAFVPDEAEVLAKKSISSAWLQIEMAAQTGCNEYVVTAHTKCGGIAALVNWSLTGAAPENPELAAYLEQAKPISDQVVAFAKAHNFADDQAKLLRFTEMHVARISASRIKAKVGKTGQVIANYLDIDTRQVYALPLIKTGMSTQQSLIETYKLVHAYEKSELLTLLGLYDALAAPKRNSVHDVVSNVFEVAREARTPV